MVYMMYFDSTGCPNHLAQPPLSTQHWALFPQLLVPLLVGCVEGVIA